MTDEIMEEDMTTNEELPEKIKRYFDCRLFHSIIPKMTSEGIIWVCKEGCDD